MAFNVGNVMKLLLKKRKGGSSESMMGTGASNTGSVVDNAKKMPAISGTLPSSGMSKKKSRLTPPKM